MKYKFLAIIAVLINSLIFSQSNCKLEFHHSNSIILFKSVDIIFKPIKNNKKGKISIKKDRDEEYSYRISKEKFEEIYEAIQKIEYDTVAVKNNLLDGSYTDIILYDNLGNKKSFYATGLNKRSQTNKFQKDFWYATKLIVKAARLEMEDLIDYR
ncbi:hypothetical protein ASG22_08085 [Chryseobacterium sp. Leaf405]|uniref:hypothetical protein n=1 Tax=Chryseobacterium sp. Leaf405 TaxID=1736367 RepID=UPI0007022A79|nr:hypothetical protein [Chryseobacterium sp. Leaf405]KQT23973.1 hypothetical protein ASG22_08085 [Chryseobacterium sp. Leaf405]